MPVATVALPGAPLVISVDLLNAINEIQKLSAVALSAAQQGKPAPDAAVEAAELRNRLIEKASAQVDKLTIEIVGLLFERINNDKHVPQAIKELLQRLQFPLIKVAVTDPALFVSADQPARKLMDRIASTSIGWTGEGEGNARYLAEVQKAIHTVLSATEEGITVFERALADFEAYLSDERTRDDDPVIRAKRALAEAEEREVLAINATIKIRSAFDGVQVESYLREFLLETWVRVLVAVMVRDREDKTTLRRYVGIVPDLVWSVQPKLGHDERKRLVATIPSVLGSLREGLLLVDWPKDRMQEFFGKLMNSHAQAVKALELAHGNPGVPFEPGAMRIKLDGIKLDDITPPPTDTPVQVPDEQVRQALASAHVDVNHLAPPSTSVTLPAADADLTDEALDTLIAGWKRGDWFNLRLGDIVERVQLRWVSPRKTLYLFMPAERRSGHSLSPESLRAYLRSGDLRPVEAEPLFDRVVNDVVSELQRTAPSAA
jgi:chorismate mutase